MTDTPEENKPKKLTLGGGKLRLGNKSLYSKNVNQTLSKGSSVVVEVKRGKVTGNNLSLTRKATNPIENETQNERRLAALKKSQTDKKDNDNQLKTLSKLVEINQESTPIQEEQIVKTDQRKELKQKEVATTHSNSSDIFKKRDNQAEEEKPSPAKPKNLEPKKLKKSDIINMLDEDSGRIPFKTRSLASIKRAREKEKRKKFTSNDKAKKLYREVILPETITVDELSNRMTERSSDVTRELMKLGVMATSTQSIDADTAEIIITSFGHSVKRVKDSDIEDNLLNIEDKPEDLIPRPPIVTVMGHVDHGKTSLLDALKSTDIVASESGGITQHIGAYTITLSNDQMITFIDTPGHEAFTHMRTRGAQITDIVVLVVAADDGIKTQTIEAINHAKAAEVPIIVAINKIDKPDANIDRVKNELLIHELVPEDLGGDIITVEVSALKKQNLDKLEEAILLLAEMQELKSNPHRASSGCVIEARVDSAKGVVATVIIQHGVLKKGDLIIAGNSYGRVKRICNDKGRTIQEAGLSLAVEIFGLNNPPSAGDEFHVVETDKQARDIIDYRIRKSKDSITTDTKPDLNELFLKSSGKQQMKEIPLIIKGDVHGSIEAIIHTLNKIESDEVKVKILHHAVGGITESDITLAKASGAIIIGFNVRANSAADKDARENKIDIRYYSIIYNLVDDIKAIMSGMLSPIIRELYIGSVDIREIFNISKVGKIAGSYVTKGIIKRGAGVRLLRDNIVIHEGKLKTLKRFKENVNEVGENFECGIAFENYDDIKIGDSVEVFDIVKEQKTL